MPEKRLLVRASADYDSNFSIVAVNTGSPTEINSQLGKFYVNVSIRDFEGSEEHQSNSLRNIENEGEMSNTDLSPKVSNLTIEINFLPSRDIMGSKFYFGNDCQTPVREYVPTALLASGLKFFQWFINPTIKGDIYCDKPFLYGLALNSFTTVSLGDQSKIVPNSVENLNENDEASSNIPLEPQKRQKYFSRLQNADQFTLYKDVQYNFRFDTNYLSFRNAKYSVSIPTYGQKTFDIDVMRYANENLDNFNWVIKFEGQEASGDGTPGLIINFKLV